MRRSLEFKSLFFPSNPVISQLYQKISSIWSVVHRQIGESRLNRIQPAFGSVFIACLLVSGVTIAVRVAGGFQYLELANFDWMMRSRLGDRDPDERLLLVTITESDIQNQNQWPLSDRAIATVLQELSQYDPAVIGLDLYRDVPHEPGHQALLAQLEKTPNLIGITKLPDAQEAGVPPPPMLPPDAIGFNDIVNDPDGVVRRNLLFASSQTNGLSYSFALRVALRYMQQQDISLENSPANPLHINFGKVRLKPLQSNSGGYQTIDANGYQILLNYRSPGAIAPEITLTEVLNGEIDPNLVKDKIVLIGTTAPSQKDLFFTPYGVKTERENLQMPGVIIHAQMLSQLLSSALDGQPLFWYWPEWVEILWVVSWSFAGGIISWRMEHPLQLGVAVMVGLVGIYGISFGLFHGAGWLPVIAPAVAFASTLSTVVVSKLLYYAFHDRLTGLPNRSLFMKQLERSHARVQIKTQKSQPPQERPVPHSAGDLENQLSVEICALNPRSTLSTLIAVLFLDLDRFKNINNGLGHDLGDRLLIAIAERIRKTLALQQRCGHFSTVEIARVGGDEFAILLENLDSEQEGIHIGENLCRQLTLPFHLQGQEVFTTASMGMALSQGEEKRDLLREAHTAMYRAKALGKLRPEVFESKMQQNAVTRFKLETDLRRALSQWVKSPDGSAFTDPAGGRRADGCGVCAAQETPNGKAGQPQAQIQHCFSGTAGKQANGANGRSLPTAPSLDSEFVLYYQPLICLKTGKIAGFEALVRWLHPERRMVSPGEFIPIAEETGLIISLGELVLWIACWQTRQWSEQFDRSTPLMMSVNLSGKQFAQPNLIEVVQQILRETNIDPSYIKLEMTESVVMDDVELAIEMLCSLKGLNLKLGIDDFGTGYSSLSYLHRFPTDTLKVDRSFVSRMNEGDENEAIVKTIITLAHNLKMDVIAEGVETADQMERLRSLGCEYGQGYFFAKPLPADAATELLACDPTWEFKN